MVGVAVLAGGVGAARLLRGLVDVVPPHEVTAIVNTGDDMVLHGLVISPDIDTVTYTVADAIDPERGWGLRDESWQAMEALSRYGGVTWFRLGDRDLATHLYRTERLAAGARLSAVTAEIVTAWDIQCRLLPMTDDPFATRIRSGGTEYALQEWFVKERAEPLVQAVRFEGAAHARPGPGVLEAIGDAETVIICPSNPVISIGPILAVPGIREALSERRDRVVGVSPIVAGAPVRGPADRLMAPLGIEVSCVGVARAYADVCSTLVIDAGDAHLAGEVEETGVRAVVADTMMRDARIAAALARHTLAAVA
jgi:LPPG:FO 2-phospho-L-lactate transferase